MFKNLTANQLNLYLSLCISLLGTVFIAFLFWNSVLQSTFGKLILVFSVIFGVCFLVNKYFLEKFIFRRIKLIYKTIHDYKLSASSKATNIDSNEMIFQNVEDEIKDWAEKTKEEITELKLLEDYRKNYVGDVSHELKTPIFAIQGFIHTLLDGALYDEQINREYLNKAAINVSRLLNIVEDLETISLLETRSEPLELTNFDLKQLVSSVFEDLRMMAEKKNIQLIFKKGAENSFSVNADREKIRQVLQNLLQNSIKYSDEGSATKVSFYDMNEYVLCEVSDNGIGISSEHIKHLFDRFYRVDRSRSRLAGGSGLGLSIVKHIIEAHNQTINVRSTPGLGSTFGFTLNKAKKGSGDTD